MPARADVCRQVWGLFESNRRVRTFHEEPSVYDCDSWHCFALHRAPDKQLPHPMRLNEDETSGSKYGSVCFPHCLQPCGGGGGVASRNTRARVTNGRARVARRALTDLARKGGVVRARIDDDRHALRRRADVDVRVVRADALVERSVLLRRVGRFVARP